MVFFRLGTLMLHLFNQIKLFFIDLNHVYNVNS
jgi:hypothetical protein